MSYIYHIYGLSCLVFVCVGSMIAPSNAPEQNLKHIHGIMPVAQPRIQVAAATKQPKVYRPIGLVAEVALPAASGLQPVLRAQGRPQQRDGQAADEKGHKYQRSLLEIHGYV